MSFQETVDFRDKETYEGLFMDYYKIIQEKEGFKIDDILAAKDRSKTGNSNIDELSDDEYDEMVSEYEEEIELSPQHRKKGLKGKLPMKQKNIKSKRMQFTGWGSTPLIQFLESIGKDTSQKIPERTVEAIIGTYIGEHKLFHPEKKRKIICNQNLRAIFGRKVVNKHKIYELLEAHYFDNLEKSEEEEEEEEGITYYSEDNDRNACKTKRKSKKEKGSPKSEAVLSIPQSCFASITAENIKLVYLRRSLVHELSKQLESFENKVIGSFIRVKSDPDDYRRTTSHQLVQVTGLS